MTFQAYLDSIHEKTGLWPDDFLAAAKEQGLTEPGVKVTAITDWLKGTYGLGHGHAMAIVQAFRTSGAIAPAKR